MAWQPQLRHKINFNPVEPDDGLGVMASCINCSFFIEAHELCKRFNARPPARVIAFGCKDHLDIQEIPF